MLQTISEYSNQLSNGMNTSSSCAALLRSSQNLIPGLNPYVARTYPAGSNFSEGILPALNLAEFCRFGANYNTSATSSFQFEVWLPTNSNWNGRFAHVGNGGDSGAVFYHDMGIPLSKYGFAVASTNTGHNSTDADGTFAISNPESQLDFGYRAVYLSTKFSKKIVEEYYKKKPSYNYWMGCSSGGKQGMKEIQEYPKDYDGILVGAPGQWWSQLLGFVMWIGRLRENASNPGGVVSPSFYLIWEKEVMAQCDSLDGVNDNIIVNPHVCSPDPSSVVCGSSKPSPFVNASTCITETQAGTLKAIYQEWKSIAGGKLFPSYLPGSEAEWWVMIGEQPFQVAVDYFLYQVYNHTSVQPTLRVDRAELERIVALAEATNPGQINAVKPDLSPYFKRGGKVLQYHGLSDGLVPPDASIDYYEKVRAYTSGSKISDSYRLFLVPGMGHCNRGSGADSFGNANQQDNAAGGAGQSLVSDPNHDAVLALMRWVEKGKAPDSLIAAGYKDKDRRQGAAFTRLLCSYPKTAKYMGGNINNSTSYQCK